MHNTSLSDIGYFSVDIEAEWLATGDTVGSPAIQCQDVASQNSFPSGASEPLSQQLHAKVGFGAGMTAHVHGVCVNDRVRVTVESSEAWARSIKLHAQATLMDKSGVTDDYAVGLLLDPCSGQAPFLPITLCNCPHLDPASALQQGHLCQTQSRSPNETPTSSRKLCTCRS